MTYEYKLSCEKHEEAKITYEEKKKVIDAASERTTP